jgi:hypothetical protein
MVTVAVPAANAGPVYPTVTVGTARFTSASSPLGDTATGGCFFLTLNGGSLTSFGDQGVIGDASVTRNPAGLPTGATVTCKLEINGATAPGTTFNYTSNVGVEAGANPILINPEGLPVALCEDVAFADGSTTGWMCQNDTTAQIPPQALIDLINGLTAGPLDTLLCPILKMLAGGYVVLTIAPDGDIYLGFYGKIYDCPPFSPF